MTVGTNVFGPRSCFPFKGSHYFDEIHIFLQYFRIGKQKHRSHWRGGGGSLVLISKQGGGGALGFAVPLSASHRPSDSLLQPSLTQGDGRAAVTL